MRHMSRPPGGGKHRGFLAALLLLGLILAACSEAADVGVDAEVGLLSISEEAPATDPPMDEPADPIAEAGGQEPPSDDVAAIQPRPAEVTPAVLPTAGRDIIFSADLTVAVTDVASAGEEATRMIQGLGGFLFGQRTTGAPETISVLTFKVEPQDFGEALRRLGSLGEVRTQNVTADDVTERIVDLQSRINTATTSVERLRDLLAQATDIETIVELENQLLARETQLETLRGQLRTLQDQVALATIVLTLTEAASRPALDLEATAYPGHDGGLSCPGGRELTVEQRTETTVCFEIVNQGDTWLTQFELRDPVLGVEMDDLIAVFGDPSIAIEPGESILLAAEVSPERSLRTRTTVTAQPVDAEGEPIPGRPAATTVSLFIETVSPAGIPSFTEGLAASWEVLVRLGQIAVLIAGALLPFIWVPVLFLLWWMRRGRTQEAVPEPSPATPNPEDV